MNSHFIIKGNRLKHWENLFNGWFITIDDSCNTVQKDAPYWYNERANIGILASAAWRIGWIALEEFQTMERRMGGERFGRAGLWLYSKSDLKL